VLRIDSPEAAPYTRPRTIPDDRLASSPPDPAVSRWAVLSLVALLAAGALAVGVARLLGRSGSRASVLVSVIAHWLAAWSLWNFAVGLAHHFGLLAVYDGPLFFGLALILGVWHYRARLASPERGRVVFVGAQLAWLLVVLVRNGVFTP
jgi:hypothetical protein